MLAMCADSGLVYDETHCDMGHMGRNTIFFLPDDSQTKAVRYTYIHMFQNFGPPRCRVWTVAAGWADDGLLLVDSSARLPLTCDLWLDEGDELPDQSASAVRPHTR